MFWKQWEFNITYCTVCNKEERDRGEVQLYIKKKGFQALLHNAQKTANAIMFSFDVFLCSSTFKSTILRLKLAIMIV